MSTRRLLYSCMCTEYRISVKAQPESVYDREFVLVRQTIRILLERGTAEKLPATYEKIYAACQAVVCNARKGEGLYDSLKLEMERCLGSLLRGLLDTPQTGIVWLDPFIQACEWFDKQVVRKTTGVHLEPC